VAWGQTVRPHPNRSFLSSKKLDLYIKSVATMVSAATGTPGQVWHLFNLPKIFYLNNEGMLFQAHCGAHS